MWYCEQKSYTHIKFSLWTRPIGNTGKRNLASITFVRGHMTLCLALLQPSKKNTKINILHNLTWCTTYFCINERLSSSYYQEKSLRINAPLLRSMLLFIQVGTATKMTYSFTTKFVPRRKANALWLVLRLKVLAQLKPLRWQKVKFDRKTLLKGRPALITRATSCTIHLFAAIVNAHTHFQCTTLQVFQHPDRSV